VVYIENALGQIIMEFPLGLNTSREVNQLLSSGMYLVRITAANGQVAVKRIIVN
jgi:hypothetical protein